MTPIGFIEDNPNYDSVYFTINRFIVHEGHRFINGQQYKWNKRRWMKTGCSCTGGERFFWEYHFPEDIRGCPVNEPEGIWLSEDFGVLESTERHFPLFTFREEESKIGIDIHQWPQDRQKNTPFTDSDGFAKVGEVQIVPKRPLAGYRPSTHEPPYVDQQ